MMIENGYKIQSNRIKCESNERRYFQYREIYGDKCMAPCTFTSFEFSGFFCSGGEGWTEGTLGQKRPSLK